ncbi:unnamed protein product [Symbiodinium pilosum]|uniref:EamA domain-containing protein n=1 Tax=Symbiodinium pilosum TaxID=2952 RepID=A0A812U8I5_SYMPI|nr:unnamed protein product [Symbiodinium pilosum]
MAPPRAEWLASSFACLLLYGFWGFLGKLALVRGLSSSQEAGLEKLGFFLTLPLILKPSATDPNAGPGLMERPKFALLAAYMSGVTAAAADFFYTRAMMKGDGGAVSAITASYPPVTMVLCATFMREKVTRNKLMGSFFTLLGAFFMARS